MSHVARYARMTAKTGHAEELVEDFEAIELEELGGKGRG
jgi:hypothetical protein